MTTPQHKPVLDHARSARKEPSRGIRGLVPLLIALFGCLFGLMALSITSGKPDPFAYIVLYFILWPGSLLIALAGFAGLLASRDSPPNSRPNLLPVAVVVYAVFLFLLANSIAFALL